MNEKKNFKKITKKYRESKIINRHLYHKLYLTCKANVYKSKKNHYDDFGKII